jgi:pyrroloquinoline quinone biosynthesis protein B
MKLFVLGIAQDAGVPQPLCVKDCCSKNNSKKLISCLGVVSEDKLYFFDCTPDFREQLEILNKKTNSNKIGGIFLTHAHMGHYTGLIHLGRESINSTNIPIYSSLKMNQFLEDNAPWVRF